MDSSLFLIVLSYKLFLQLDSVCCSVIVVINKVLWIIILPSVIIAPRQLIYIIFIYKLTCDADMQNCRNASKQMQGVTGFSNWGVLTKNLGVHFPPWTQTVPPR